MDHQNIKVLEKITNKTKELRELLSTIDRRTAIPAFMVILYISMTDYTFGKLKSTVKQIGYLIRLLLHSEGHCEISTDEVEEVFTLLEDIQELYYLIHDSNEAIVPDNFTENQKKALIAQSSFANRFYNTDLLFLEQELDRIERIFSPYNLLIKSKEGFTVDQIILFCIETNIIALKKIQMGLDKLLNLKKEMPHSINFITEDFDCYSLPFSHYKEYLFSAQDYTLIDATLAESLLAKFSIPIESPSSYDFCDELIYYCQHDNPLTKRPLLKIEEGKYLLYFNIQLSVAIYTYLNDLPFINKVSLSRSKANALETKTSELLDILDNQGQVYKNYAIYPKGKEKDILFISGDIVFIIECKSNKHKKTYSRDREEAFNIIEQEFNRSISEAFSQAKEVADVIKKRKTVTLYKKDSDSVIGELDLSNIKKAHILIVTQERYSLIQNNPSLLLHEKADKIPSCFCVDDLETIILTFSKLDKPLQYFSEYLSVKESFSSQLLYEDELELAGKFLFDRQNLINCIGSQHYYRTDSFYSDYFDIMYNEFGLGFPKELDTPGKLHISQDGLKVYEDCKRIGLKLPPEVEEFCQEQKKTGNLPNKNH